MKSRKSIPLVLVGAVAFITACSGPDAAREERLAELRSERRSLLEQFSTVQLPIRRVQAKALEEPGVRSAQEAFYTELRGTALREDPGAAELFERARAVGHELDFMQNPAVLSTEQESSRTATQDEPAALAQELAELERALRPVISRAMRDPAVSEAFDVLRDSVIAAMLRADPHSERAMDRMVDIEGQVARIDAEIASLLE